MKGRVKASDWDGLKGVGKFNGPGGLLAEYRWLDRRLGIAPIFYPQEEQVRSTNRCVLLTYFFQLNSRIDGRTNSLHLYDVPGPS